MSSKGLSAELQYSLLVIRHFEGSRGTQLLRALAAFEEGPGSDPRAHVVAQTIMVVQMQKI